MDRVVQPIALGERIADRGSDGPQLCVALSLSQLGGRAVGSACSAAAATAGSTWSSAASTAPAAAARATRCRSCSAARAGAAVLPGRSRPVPHLGADDAQSLLGGPHREPGLHLPIRAASRAALASTMTESSARPAPAPPRRPPGGCAATPAPPDPARPGTEPGPAPARCGRPRCGPRSRRRRGCRAPFGNRRQPGVLRLLGGPRGLQRCRSIRVAGADRGELDGQLLAPLRRGVSLGRRLVQRRLDLQQALGPPASGPGPAQNLAVGRHRHNVGGGDQPLRRGDVGHDRHPAQQPRQCRPQAGFGGHDVDGIDGVRGQIRPGCVLRLVGRHQQLGPAAVGLLQRGQRLDGSAGVRHGDGIGDGPECCAHGDLVASFHGDERRHRPRTPATPAPGQAVWRPRPCEPAPRAGRRRAPRLRRPRARPRPPPSGPRPATPRTRRERRAPRRPRRPAQRPSVLPPVRGSGGTGGPGSSGGTGGTCCPGGAGRSDGRRAPFLLPDGQLGLIGPRPSLGDHLAQPGDFGAAAVDLGLRSCQAAVQFRQPLATLRDRPTGRVHACLRGRQGPLGILPLAAPQPHVGLALLQSLGQAAASARRPPPDGPVARGRA